jgi:hypothetical protein
MYDAYIYKEEGKLGQDAEINRHDKDASCYAKITKGFNFCSTGLMFLGLICLASFFMATF